MCCRPFVCSCRACPVAPVFAPAVLVLACPVACLLFGALVLCPCFAFVLLLPVVKALGVFARCFWRCYVFITIFGGRFFAFRFWGLPLPVGGRGGYYILTAILLNYLLARSKKYLTFGAGMWYSVGVARGGRTSRGRKNF